jgi:hypothetical protein
MPRIRIVSIPEGPGIPEEIRKEWVGIEFEAEGPVQITVQSVTDPTEFHDFLEVYKVSTDVALQALKKKSHEAWRWFMANATAPTLCFKTESCEVIRD